jgi:hypothetical protein
MRSKNGGYGFIVAQGSRERKADEQVAVDAGMET